MDGRRTYRVCRPPAAIAGKRQTACKPGSVPAGAGDGHSSGTPVAGRLARPTRAAARKPARSARFRGICRPYLVLLPVGFAVPSPLPAARCALAAPFHPCRPCSPMGEHGLGGLLSVALSLGSPPPGVTRHRVPVEPGLSSPRAAPRRARRAAIRPSGNGLCGPAATACQTLRQAPRGGVLTRGG
jgi:hypothetical protein